MPSRNPKFLVEGLDRLEMDGKEIRLKGGNLLLKWEDGIFTMKHFGTQILRINFRKSVLIPEKIENYYICSMTDARYITTALDIWFPNDSDRIIRASYARGFEYRNSIDDKWKELVING